jgi:hypothetical protein
VSGNDHDPQFRDIADHLGAILWISDPDGERMLFCSQAYETMWGRPVAELYSEAESWMEGVHPTTGSGCSPRGTGAGRA